MSFLILPPDTGCLSGRGGATEVLEGDWRPKRLVIIEFPSMGDLLAFYNSSEYRAVQGSGSAMPVPELLR